MAKRPYTGHDKDASGRRAGMEEFVKLTCQHFNGGVWNNGTWGVRSQNRPGKSRPSVHGTGRAADISWQKDVMWKGKKVQKSARAFGNHEKALQVVDFWLANADLFLIEELHDYYPAPFGRGWRCNRAAWKTYQKQTIGNAPGGTWFHVEIAPAHADDAAYYQRAFAQASGQPVPAQASAPTASTGGAAGALTVPAGSPELTTADKGTVKPAVKELQRILIAKGWASFSNADGRYGNKTLEAVKTMQGAVGFSGSKVDGRYGKNTAARLQAHLNGGG